MEVIINILIIYKPIKNITTKLATLLIVGTLTLTTVGSFAEDTGLSNQSEIVETTNDEDTTPNEQVLPTLQTLEQWNLILDSQEPTQEEKIGVVGEFLALIKPGMPFEPVIALGPSVMSILIEGTKVVKEAIVFLVARHDLYLAAKKEEADRLAKKVFYCKQCNTKPLECELYTSLHKNQVKYIAGTFFLRHSPSKTFKHESCGNNWLNNMCYYNNKCKCKCK